MQFLDKTCSNIFTKIFKIMKCTCTPCKLICRIITRFFERPYSLCFILDFFILISPSLLLVGMLTQNSDYINFIVKFNYIFYGVLINLIINFISVFYIYEVYGRHTLDEVKKSFTVSSFLKETLKFLFSQTRLGYIGIYYVLQIIFYFISLRFLYSDSDLNSDKMEIPVLIDFTKIATICGLIFTLAHIVIYLILFMVLLCAINNSCLFGLCLKNQEVEISSESHKKQVDIKSNQESDKNQENEKNFYIYILACYRFFGLYDYKRYLDIDYLDTENVLDLRNDV